MRFRVHSILDREYGRHPYVISVSRASVSITVMVARQEAPERYGSGAILYAVVKRAATKSHKKRGVWKENPAAETN